LGAGASAGKYRSFQPQKEDAREYAKADLRLLMVADLKDKGSDLHRLFSEIVEHEVSPAEEVGEEV
jgi:hypothetical protein